MQVPVRHVPSLEEAEHRCGDGPHRSVDSTRSVAKPWTLDAAAVLLHLGSSPCGLSVAEARQRLERGGPNRLRENPPRPAWLRFLDQFKNLLVGVLVGAAALAGAIGDIKDALVIAVVIVLNAGLDQARACVTPINSLKYALTAALLARALQASRRAGA